MLGSHGNMGKMLEARVGIEPTHKGFADLSLTTWVPRPDLRTKEFTRGEQVNKNLERETGFEPATSTLARSHSTTELLPLAPSFYSSWRSGATSGARAPGRILPGAERVGEPVVNWSNSAI